jgi:plasmid stability protein
VKALQVRDVPEDVLRVLRVRAAEQGLSLSGYVLQVLREHAAQPTIREVVGRPRSGWARATRDEVVDAIRSGREEREESWSHIARARHGR